ncbi:hypothetical protein MnTg02_02048 [bacterium MnTg02]|nr:hypothetical protein MnTg02_02048 [bacterium MnTg02]
MSEYLTTKELAELLRIKERKVYDLAASGEIPCSRAMGKLLFPRHAVNAWLAENSSGFTALAVTERPNVFLGSHDPLLEWALRESRCGMATFFDGSLDGLERFSQGEGVAAGLHIFDPPTGDWNVPIISERFGREPVVLTGWALRERGLIIGREMAGKIEKIEDLKGRRVVPRQAEAGSQGLLEHLLSQANIARTDVEFIASCRTETDAALAVLEGKADAALGLKMLADQYRLDFVPVMSERFDLLVDRRAWFEPPMQTFLDFCRSDSFLAKVRDMPGYDVSPLGRVHFNGA